MSPRKKKPRRGRPPGPPENVRRCLVVLRLTAEEHAWVAAAAKAAGVAVAEWMRALCVDAASMRLGAKRLSLDKYPDALSRVGMVRGPIKNKRTDAERLQEELVREQRAAAQWLGLLQRIIRAPNLGAQSQALCDARSAIGE